VARKSTIHPRLVAVTVGGLLTSALFVTAPPAQGCPAGQVEDTVTRMCWSQSGQGDSSGGAGGLCLPGRLGNCVGTLQKASPAPAAKNPAVPCGFGPDSGYPCGYWPAPPDWRP
jgi:hypothetical protein